MSLSVVGTSLPQYQIATIPQAAIDDERAQSAALAKQETATDKVAPIQASTSAHAVDIQA